MKSVMFFSQSGCFLPLLIILNLFFGLIFFKIFPWLVIGTILVLLFIINSLLLIKRIGLFSKRKNGKKVVDIEGKIIEEDNKSSSNLERK